MDNRENHAGFLVRELCNAIKKRSAAQDNNSTNEQDHVNKLTMMQRWILGYIVHHPDHDIFQHELERELNIGKSTLTEVLHLMEKNDLVKRVPSEKDGRCKKIIMTEKSRKIDKQITDNIKKMEKKMREGISEEDYEVFLRTIKKMISNITE
ncbi:MAG: MarR family winged helix-turn-helix transcriptional regulator [Lachnospiraceae bacterium]